MLMNEKIKASEVVLTGLQGEDLGMIRTTEALAIAKQNKADLVCTSMMSFPPPCRLMPRGSAKEEAQQAKKRQGEPKLKEIRLSPNIEDHDLETKREQAERILRSGDAVQLVVKLQGKEGQKGKELLEILIKDLRTAGKPKSGIQLSGKQAVVQLDPM
ncbi:translation initiation factor IF-3 [Paenibacillus swuensis]|uniref:Translation initiation factor IF-3 n=1 Tax=Paenibacillus swuensis TaxID=1178515 RepID=A0A172TKY4_9BACL|nr:translation initiation factor IF-3 [Paenibacillus swuensis]ANE47690.1 translation initiation factor IF-3 [Paenibacillus swuensis]